MTCTPTLTLRTISQPHSSELQSNSVFQPLEESLDSILVTLQELGQDEERRSSRILAQLNSMLASSAAMAARLDRVNGTLHDNVAQLLDLDTTLHEGFDNRAELVRSRDA